MLIKLAARPVPSSIDGAVARRRALARKSTLVVVLVGSSALLGACAGDVGPSRLGGPMPVSGPGPASILASPAVAQPLVAAEPLRRQAMSDRVLAAMALERVTGRRPSPGRLMPAGQSN